jgi:tetratricopeptide (TPR) repeat protein
MKKGRFQADDYSCMGSQNYPPNQKEPAGSLNQQPCLLLEPSPEEAEKMALQSALVNYKKAVEAESDSAWAWYQYGDALLGLKQTEEAVPALRKAVELSPETALFHYNLGLALYELNQSEAAIKEFAGIVANDPKLKYASSGLVLAAIANLALSQEKLGQRDEAIQTLLPAQENAVGILFNLGFLHFRAKRFDAALPYAQAAYILKPNNEDIVHLYGSTLNELKRPGEAVKILKLATQLEPACASAWYDLGFAFARLKHRKRARACFLRSLQLAPADAWPYYDLARLDALEGKRNVAFKHLMQAVVRGFRDIGHLRQDSDLRSLRRDARWKTLLTTIGDLEKSNN